MSDYVLGSSDREIERLGYQHEIWFGETAALWERAGLGLGSVVADFGCGPGLCTRALSRLVGPQGKVYAVDASDRFAGLVGQFADGVDNVEFYQSDVSKTLLTDASCDAVFARWLYCFLPEPATALAEAKRILKPGGCIILFDYFNYLAADVFPQNPKFRCFLKDS